MKLWKFQTSFSPFSSYNSTASSNVDYKTAQLKETRLENYELRTNENSQKDFVFYPCNRTFNDTQMNVNFSLKNALVFLLRLCTNKIYDKF